MLEMSDQTHDNLEVKDDEVSEERREVELSILGENNDRDEKVDDQIDEDRNEDPIDVPQIATKRGRGRPRKVMTGLRGRPKKLFKESNAAMEEAEFAYLAEMPFNESIKGPDAEEWLRTIATEMKAIIKNDT